MGEIDSHLGAWRAAGLIDDGTVERIRAWDAARARSAGEGGRSSIGAILGPGITIAEAFAYLGVAFLLAATDVFLGRMASNPRADQILAVGAAIQAAALFAVGLGLLRGDARRRRAAGVAFLVATAHAGAAGLFGAQAAGAEDALPPVVGSVAALAVATLGRRLHPALTTQLAVLSAATCLAAALLSLIEQLIFGPRTFDANDGRATAGLAITVGPAAWWLLTGLLLGLVGLYEARREGVDARAAHRAGLTRLWAGVVAIGGFCSAVTRSDALPNGDYGRVLEPFIAEIAILVVSAILIERAFRRSSAAFVVAGAIGLIVALTDFNFSYLSDQTEVGLLIEGLILLAVGFGADRIRRRLGRDRATDDAPADATLAIDQPVEAAPDP